MNLTERRKAARALGNRVRVPGTIRSATTSNGKLVFRGLASAVERPYAMSFYTETIARGAFKKTLASNPDTVFVLNHGADGGLALARTGSTTCPLRLTETYDGLTFEATVDPTRYQAAAEVAHAVEDGLIRSCSFGFVAEVNSWDADYTQRRIEQVSLDMGDVSVVTFPASPWTHVSVGDASARGRRDLEVYRARARTLAGRGAGSIDLDTYRARAWVLNRQGLH